jgi:type II secretory pathway component PulF
MRAMLERIFPTFTRWLMQIGKPRFGKFSLWKLRGPKWYIETWLGDSRSIQQRSLLRVLAVAHDQRLEHAPLVQSLAEEHRGRFRRVLNRLARRLGAGTTLLEALEQTPDALDDDTVLALRFGSHSGSLQSAFEMLLSREVTATENPGSSAKQVQGYWVVLAFTIAILLMFMLSVIAPTYKKMYEEFGLTLPWLFQVLLTICDQIAMYAGLWMLLGVVVVGLFSSSSVRKFLCRAVAPVFWPVEKARTGALLKLLAMTVDSGRPIAGSLSTLARYHFDSRTRLRLLFARNEIEQGVDSWQGLAKAGFLTGEQAEAISNAPTAEIRGWTIRRLASSLQNSAQLRSSIAFTLLQPVIVLLFGAIVLFIFASFFSVLIKMITSLA